MRSGPCHLDIRTELVFHTTSEPAGSGPATTYLNVVTVRYYPVLCWECSWCPALARSDGKRWSPKMRETPFLTPQGAPSCQSVGPPPSSLHNCPTKAGIHAMCVYTFNHLPTTWLILTVIACDPSRLFFTFLTDCFFPIPKKIPSDSDGSFNFQVKFLNIRFIITRCFWSCSTFFPRNRELVELVPKDSKFAPPRLSTPSSNIRFAPRTVVSLLG